MTLGDVVADCDRDEIVDALNRLGCQLRGRSEIAAARV